MRRVGLTRLSLLLLVLTAGLAAVSCGSNSSSSSSTTSPSPATKTETYSGTFAQSGSSSNAFSVAAAGTVTVTVTTLAPLSTMSVGTRLMTWDGTTCGSTIAQNPNSRINTAALTGTAAIGNYCVQVFDSGNVAADWTVEYTLTVTHP
jgi:hypothetical protein